MITVFTPTYNRKNSLKTLVESLRSQRNMNFEWVIVDDGSTDGTREYIEEIRDKCPFNILYRYVKNGGKMRAINKGVTLARGEFFFIVDSDDFISDDAIEKIISYGKNLPKDMGGMVFRKINRIDAHGDEVHFPKKVMDSTPCEIVYKLGISGDKAEVFRTEILKKYPFNVYEGEKFIPEALVWMAIGERYKLRYIDEGIYYYEYLCDGYTQNFMKILRDNPKGFRLYYKEMIKYNLPLVVKLKFILRLIQVKWYIMLGGNR